MLVSLRGQVNIFIDCLQPISDLKGPHLIKIFQNFCCPLHFFVFPIYSIVTKCVWLGNVTEYKCSIMTQKGLKRASP